jgi:anti-anti-sigma factor
MFDVHHDGDVAILAVTQPLEGFRRLVARRQIDELLDAGTVRLVLDLSGVRIIDSSGVGSLVAAHHRARAAGGAVCLCRVTPKVRRTFDVMLLHQILPIRDTREEAVTHVRELSEPAGD